MRMLNYASASSNPFRQDHRNVRSSSRNQRTDKLPSFLVSLDKTSKSPLPRNYLTTKGGGSGQKRCTGSATDLLLCPPKEIPAFPAFTETSNYSSYDSVTSTDSYSELTSYAAMTLSSSSSIDNSLLNSFDASKEYMQEKGLHQQAGHSRKQASTTKVSKFWKSKGIKQQPFTSNESQPVSHTSDSTVPPFLAITKINAARKVRQRLKDLKKVDTNSRIPICDEVPDCM